jgi:hypothetical protein
MNLARRTSLSLLFVTLNTVSANAALTGDSGSAGMSIETASDNTSLQSLDQVLDGGNNSDLFGSVMQQHATAAQPATSTMDGHFGGVGAVQPTVFDQRSPTGQIVSSGKIVSSGQTMPSAPAAPAGEAPNLSLTVAVHTGITAQADAPVASFSSPSSPVTGGSYLPTDSGITTPPPVPAPVPLPAAGLLFASGLAALPAIRRKRQE